MRRRRGRRSERRGGDRPRHHDPLRVLAHHVARWQGKPEVRGQQHVDPGVHLEPPRPRPLEQAGERVEGVGLPPEQRAAAHEVGVVEGVAAATNLHEQGVEAGFRGVVHDLVHGPGRDEGGAHDPEPAELGRRGRRAARQSRGEQGDSEGAIGNLRSATSMRSFKPLFPAKSSAKESSIALRPLSTRPVSST